MRRFLASSHRNKLMLRQSVLDILRRTSKHDLQTNLRDERQTLLKVANQLKHDKIGENFIIMFDEVLKCKNIKENVKEEVVKKPDSPQFKNNNPEKTSPVTISADQQTNKLQTDSEAQVSAPLILNQTAPQQITEPKPKTKKPKTRDARLELKLFTQVGGVDQKEVTSIVETFRVKRRSDLQKFKLFFIEAFNKWKEE